MPKRNPNDEGVVDEEVVVDALDPDIGGQKEPDETPASKFATWEETLWAEGFSVVAGTDEAGRGPLAGPVTAAAYAVLDHQCAELREMLFEVAADSKQCTEAQRDTAYARLTDDKWRGKSAWGVVEMSSSRIDESNILRASLAAMSEAVQSIEPKPDCVLVDGCNRPPELLRPGEQWTRGSRAEEMAKADTKQSRLSAFFTKKPSVAKIADAPWRPRRVEAVINGDAQVLSIAAASIIAKVHRDNLMAALHERYPVYGFAEHKGYGTASHLEAIRSHGPCPEHRRSFGPIQEAVKGDGASAASAGGILAALGRSTSSEPVAKTPKKIAASRVDLLEQANGAPAGTTIVSPARDSLVADGDKVTVKRGRKPPVGASDTPAKVAKGDAGSSANSVARGRINNARGGRKSQSKQNDASEASHAA